MVVSMGLAGALEANLAQQEPCHPYTPDHLATIRNIIAEAATALHRTGIPPQRANRWLYTSSTT